MARQAEEYELGPAELRLLEDAVREVDLIEDRTALQGADLTVSGSHGQPVRNPLAQEVRLHRGVLRQLLSASGFQIMRRNSWSGLSTLERGRRAAMTRRRKPHA